MTPADFLLYIVFVCNTTMCGSTMIDEHTAMIMMCRPAEFGLPVDDKAINQLELPISNGLTLKFHVDDCKDS